MKILLIEDDEDTIEILQTGIELYFPTAETASASRGRDAIDLLKTGGFDVALLDLGLPDMDGLEVLEEIRRFSKMPIVVVSARHNAQIIAQAKALGATEYVTKPFKIDFLANRIRELVNLAT